MTNVNSKYVPLIITIKVINNSLVNICKKMIQDLQKSKFYLMHG